MFHTVTLPSIVCFLLLSMRSRAESPRGARSPHKLASRVDFETVAFAQEAILEDVHNKIQNTFLPKLWKLSVTRKDPSPQLASIEALFSNAVPSLRNVTSDSVPPGTTGLQTDVEFQLGMRLVRPFLDILVPLGRFERTAAFMALLPPPENSFEQVLGAVLSVWEDEFISNVSAGLVSGLEFTLLNQLNMFGILTELGLTA